MHPDLAAKVKGDVDKLVPAGIIQEVQYPFWLANIVLIKKKNVQIRVCIDFRDLKRACPKEDFPLFSIWVAHRCNNWLRITMFHVPVFRIQPNQNASRRCGNDDVSIA